MIFQRCTGSIRVVVGNGVNNSLMFFCWTVFYLIERIVENEEDPGSVEEFVDIGKENTVAGKFCDFQV
jgi:hypothetical protein